MMPHTTMVCDSNGQSDPLVRAILGHDLARLSAGLTGLPAYASMRV